MVSYHSRIRIILESVCTEGSFYSRRIVLNEIGCCDGLTALVRLPFYGTLPLLLMIF